MKSALFLTAVFLVVALGVNALSTVNHKKKYSDEVEETERTSERSFAAKAKARQNKLTKYRLKQIKEMSDLDFEIFSSYDIIPIDSPAIFFAMDAYGINSINGQILTSSVNKIHGQMYLLQM